MSTPSSLADHPHSAIASNAEAVSGTELIRSRWAPVLHWLYRVLNCQRHWRLARVLIAMAHRLEGGAMRSATSRRWLAEYHGVEIGAFSYGECFDPALVPPGVRIGRYVSVARGVRLFTQNHPLERLSTHPFFYEAEPGHAASGDLPPGRLEIGNDVWIGCNAIVTPGCHRIGHGVVIGAGAVVTRDVPDFAIVAGNPARRLRDRFSPEVVAQVLATEWWNLPYHEINARRREFDRLVEPSEDDSSLFSGSFHSRQPETHNEYV